MFLFIKKIFIGLLASVVSALSNQKCQRIIQTKMEVGIRFWVPDLDLSPKYD